jgi:hypothetical protein
MSDYLPDFISRNFNMICGLLVVIIIIVIVIVTTTKEHMSSGTLTQLFANDVQDTYLKSNVDQLATGNFNLFWNQPTMVANSLSNRGELLPNSIMNGSLIEKDMNIEDNAEPVGMHKKSCSTCGKRLSNLQMLSGNGAGGERLGQGFIDPSTLKPFVNLENGEVVYPDSYVGSYYTDPVPDIMKPYPYIPNKIY